MEVLLFSLSQKLLYHDFVATADVHSPLRWLTLEAHTAEGVPAVGLICHLTFAILHLIDSCAFLRAVATTKGTGPAQTHNTIVLRSVSIKHNLFCMVLAILSLIFCFVVIFSVSARATHVVPQSFWMRLVARASFLFLLQIRLQRYD